MVNFRRTRSAVAAVACAAAVSLCGLASAAAPASAASAEIGSSAFARIAGTVAAHRAFHIAPNPAQCATLGRSLRNRAASCVAVESIHVSLVRPAGFLQARTSGVKRTASSANNVYLYGYLQACASLLSSGYCNPNTWWVTDNFNVTVNGSQAWNNGTPSCAANHTDVTWCSYSNNGKSVMQEGFNFGTNGWARMGVYGVLASCGIRGSSYAFIEGVLTVNGATNCDAMNY
jgi:hypothetical protein